jgi:glycine cleavage system transcriptional repressor
MMEKRFIITAFGKDRPGIVADVTQVLYENGCNLEDSTMTLLSDEFALILLFTGQEEGLEERLVKDCRRLEKEKGLSAFIRPVSGEKVETKAPIETRSLHVEGIDQAGIVYKVSRYLSDNKINIANLLSRRTISAESGTAIYTMEIQVEIPEGTVLDDLETGLARIGDQLNVDITFN